MTSLRTLNPRIAALFVLALLALVLAACDDDQPEISAESTVVLPGVRVEPTPIAEPTPAPPQTTLLFTGDIIPVRCTHARIVALGDPTAPYHALRDQLNGADLTVGTLDTTISTVAQPIGCTPTFNLASTADALRGLEYAGFDVLSHAANHIADCGAIACGYRAMFETRWLLKSAGIAPVGSGGDLREARAPAVVERNGVWFAFLAYDDIASYYHAGPSAPGSAPLDPSTIAADVAAARNFADVVVVLPHWGVEYVAEPTARQRAFAQAAADAGADLVVGNHPHWVQAHEQVGATFVAYALGNFVFDQDWSRETQQGAMLEVTFAGDEISGYRYIPIRIHDQYQPRIAEWDEAWEILRRIEAASEPLRAP
jgi:poly-gamma-glutamate synthesis protein (capsule biosynthesis protein)